MIVDDKLLDKLEKLAMINIEADKRESFKEELTQIIEKMDSLQEVDTDSVRLLYDNSTPLRDDIVINAEIRDDILLHTPKKQDGYFIVPKVI